MINHASNHEQDKHPFPYKSPPPTHMTPAIEQVLDWLESLTDEDVYLWSEHLNAGIVTERSQELQTELADYSFLLKSGVLNAPRFS